MLLLQPAYVLQSISAATTPGPSRSPRPEDVLKKLYAATLWLGESHTPMAAFIAAFAPLEQPLSSERSKQTYAQRVRIKHDDATVRSAVTYVKQLKPLFAMLRGVEELRRRHEPRPTRGATSDAAGAESVSRAAPSVAKADSRTKVGPEDDALSELDREVLSTLCSSSSHSAFNPTLEHRRAYHARETQLQIVLVLYLLRYITRHPPPADVPPFLPPPASTLGVAMGGMSAISMPARPFGGRTVSMPASSSDKLPVAAVAAAGKSDVLALNKRYEALVEHLSVLQLRAVVPELHQVGASLAQAANSKSRTGQGMDTGTGFLEPLYARRATPLDGLSASAIPDTPSKHSLHVAPPPKPRIGAVDDQMGVFYKPILKALFDDGGDRSHWSGTELRSQLALFRDRCGDIDVAGTVWWASDGEDDGDDETAEQAGGGQVSRDRRQSGTFNKIPSRASLKADVVKVKVEDEDAPWIVARTSSLSTKLSLGSDLSKSMSSTARTADNVMKIKRQARSMTPSSTAQDLGASLSKSRPGSSSAPLSIKPASSRQTLNRLEKSGRVVSMDTRTFTRSTSVGVEQVGAVLAGPGPAGESVAPGSASVQTTVTTKLLADTSMSTASTASRKRQNPFSTAASAFKRVHSLGAPAEAGRRIGGLSVKKEG